MTRGRLRGALLLLILSAAALQAGAEAFVIDRYDIDMVVREDNSYEITENITVYFTEDRHGIYRDIPREFDGNRVKISKIRVHGWEKKVTWSSSEVSIRIGDADEYVNGRQSFRISYVYDVGADNLPDMDEFNHNIIGLWWDTDIEEAIFRIEMPKDFDASKLNITSGDYGSTDSSGVEWGVKGRSIIGQTTRPLEPHQGITAALPLPEGYWVGAKDHAAAGKLLFTILGYPLFALCILGSFLVWYRYGRDNRLFPSVEFHPPEGMNPSEIGYIIDGSVDNRDVTALIVYWAQQGCLEIEEIIEERRLLKDKKSLELIRITDLPKDAHKYEHRLFKKLFSYGDGTRVSTDDLEDKFYSEISKAQKEIKKSFTGNPERAIYQKGNKKWTALAVLFAALPIISILMEGFMAFSGVAAFSFMGIPFSLFLIIPSIMLGSALGKGGDAAKAQIVFALMFGGFSFLFFGGFLVFATEEGVPLLKYLAAVVSGIASGIFVSIMTRRTEYGDRILEKTLGFREFIKEAEKDKLETLFASDPAYFYDILPYAMVLNLTDQWAGHFEGIAMEPPRWYRGYAYDRFSTAAFATAMQGSFRSISSSMTSSPSSSGSSGSSSSGGFSGGGSGGGGGGSW